MQIVRFADLAYYSDEMLSLYWLNEYGKIEAEVTCKDDKIAYLSRKQGAENVSHHKFHQLII